VECAARKARSGLYSAEDARWWALNAAAEGEQVALKTSMCINADATRRGRRAGEQPLTGAEGDEKNDSADANGAGP
jgi:hypothetical protein